jgi:3-oxoacyl-[acyl-carrier-protein] synthase-1
MSPAPPTAPLAVRAVGMVCSVGLDAASSCAAIRARLARVQEIPFMNRMGQPVVAAVAREIAPERIGHERLAPLLARAVRECAENARSAGAPAGELPPLLVGMDSADRPDYPEGFAGRFLQDVQAELGIPLSKESQVFPEDTAGFFRALGAARTLLESRKAEACIVAAVDSLANGPALNWLQDRGRLKMEKHPDGIIPGEAAAALWVERPKSGAASIAQIRGFGFGEEPSVLKKGEPHRSEGMTQALRAALSDARTELSRIDFRVGGMTGERKGFMEASTAVARVQKVHKDDFELWVPAEKLGDVGAALPACMAVVAATGIRRGYAPGKSAVLFVASRTPVRSACVMAAAEDTPGGA